MHFEDLLEEVGSFGLYQRVLCFLLIPITTGVVGLTYYFQLFILTAPPHTCRQEVVGNATQMETLLEATPYTSAVREPYVCHQFPANYTLPVNASSLASLSAPSVPCDNGWDYDYQTYFSSYTSERDWVCDEAWRNYLVVTLFWVGNTVGSWLWGLVSDLRGRRVAIAGSLLVYSLAGLASVFAKDFYLFSTLRFLVGSSHHTVTHLPFVLVVEYCGLKARVVPLFTIMVTYTLASIAAPAIAYLVWDWTYLTLIAAIPSLAFLLGFKWLPESASWLLTKGRVEAARTQLSRVAKVNKQELSGERLTTLLVEAGEGEADGDKKKSGGGVSILQAVQYPKLRCNILLVLLVWMLACMCFYGHCQNTANLGSSVLMSYLLGAVVEVPSWCVPLLIHRFGRRMPLASAFLISALAGFIYALVPADMEWLVLVVALMGRASITGAYYITLQYGPEIFPTEVRGQGVALSETLGGVAIFISPMVVYLGEFKRTAPLLVFAGLSVLGGGATLLLPETAGMVLPQTLAQAEVFSRQATPLCCGSRSKGEGKEEEQGDETL
ncbi:organic cation transporter protein-like [Portunus trituberculatus]|uniref:organic cation transporter protein-like n=1 Tax=Portunus trituberculatus TaxID=210409 RepID=UPI001E1CF024|nr:organic cation transporter protein-like [Portunus trituberculatus]XP_045120505.1 organic cation transporter protein-like [Portunus trituberculatus]XP_045120506.1 organic cation transporter protein-like [Portunus trituberculatus]